jgi:beta-galactosidase
MKTILYFLFFAVIGIFLFLSCVPTASEKISEDRQRSFDNDWKFIKDSLSGAENPGFDDSKWRTLDLPHDWSIEDLPGSQTADKIGPFLKETTVGNTIGIVTGGFLTGHTVGGTGWYRKNFSIDKKDKGKIVKVLFDGVLTESDVWLNGKHLGYHPNGYTPFAYDLTQYLNPAGQKNVLAVRAKNIGQTSRWYSGSGIYRHVSLVVTDPVHIDLWGVYVFSSDVSKEKATVNINIKVENSTKNDDDIKIETSLSGKNGKIAGKAEKSEMIAGGVKKEINESITLNNPDLWSPDFPNLYKIKVNVLLKGKLLDSYTMNMGIRSIKYSPQTGFTINDQQTKLRGGCMHHDNGILGAAAFDRAEERRVAIMKANGFNAIRCSHNMPSPKFLDACDSLGMLVMDEVFDTWTKPKTACDYHLFFKEYWQQDLQTMIMRDRNHPGVIIWSIGNEIAERADPAGLELTKQLIGEVKKLDTVRPISEAICAYFPFMGQNHEWSYSAPAFAMLDIGGYNYTWNEWQNDHTLYPERLMMTTESMPIDMFHIWKRIEQSPWVIGDFVWTGMDYLGESGVANGKIDNEKVDYGMGFPGTNMGFGRGWPWFVAWCGDIDIIGSKKPQSYYRDVVWNRSKMEIAVHTPLPSGHNELISPWGWPSELPCWTWPGEEGKTFSVSVYTRCDSVRLELNGIVIGKKKVKEDPDLNQSASGTAILSGAVPNTQLTARFEVPYAPGELKAIGLVDGKEVVTKILKSTGAPKKLILTADRSSIHANRNDLAFITVEVADENGNKIPNINIPVDFTISGEGELAAAGNGSPNQMTSFHQPKCNTFRGKALIIIRPFARPGTIKLTANCHGLGSATADILVR